MSLLPPYNDFRILSTPVTFGRDFDNISNEIKAKIVIEVGRKYKDWDNIINKNYESMYYKALGKDDIEFPMIGEQVKLSYLIINDGRYNFDLV